MSFLSQLTKAKVRHEPPAIRASAGHAWLRRWSSILACSASKSFASSLLELRGGLGADGPTPSSSEVVTDDRFFRLVDQGPLLVESFLSVSRKKSKKDLHKLCQFLGNFQCK